MIFVNGSAGLLSEQTGPKLVILCTSKAFITEFVSVTRRLSEVLHNFDIMS